MSFLSIMGYEDPANVAMVLDEAASSAMKFLDENEGADIEYTDPDTGEHLDDYDCEFDDDIFEDISDDEMDYIIDAGAPVCDNVDLDIEDNLDCDCILDDMGDLIDLMMSGDDDE